ncbi:hypothetical protein BO224_11020 [Erysipelotrichaceae bacterium NYU-BL-E8]|uniref:Uncharacterized protein n=1 Tax=Ileibacterium valens TaxID=1862668 RepID=A0A1U7NEW3_9FIRM|nr:hypothetical protein BO224_11020 [Erysipelotrichaceae bacterium NYU-BL-E8]OLU38436.1 hypothetical protein BO222_08370 [Ileibacterium valens]OLU43530.1 hypothetical protein BM735_00090 [Erysipelotrichaceae bacterium NYU-BL-F16]
MIDGSLSGNAFLFVIYDYKTALFRYCETSMIKQPAVKRKTFRGSQNPENFAVNSFLDRTLQPAKTHSNMDLLLFYPVLKKDD